jgi:hypothetical protein
MADNVLMKLTTSIDADTNKGVADMLEQSLEGIDCIYSYIVYAEYDDKDVKSYCVQCNISQTDRYNTLAIKDVIRDVTDIINNYETMKHKKVIGYGQPDVALMLEAYDPLVNKLASIQNNKWDMYTYEDLCQICRLEILTLYRKGYYIHKRLVEKAFINRLLMNTRHERNKPLCLSFEDVFYKTSSSDSEKLQVADTIPDTDLIEKEKEEEERIAESLIFEEVKAIIIDLLGPRRWDELLRCYGSNVTTATTRKNMQIIKNYFEKLGLSRKDFNKKYYE